MIETLLAFLIMAASVTGIIFGISWWIFSEYAYRQLTGCAIFIISILVAVSFVTGYLLK